MRIDGETHRHAKRIGAAVARGKGFGKTPELEAYLESDPKRIMAALEGFALHVRLENESSDALACGFLQLIEMQLQRLRYEKERGHQWARTLIEQFQQEVAERVRRRSLKGTGLSMIGGALKEAGLAPIEALVAANFEEMQLREDEPTSDLEARANDSLAELVEQTGGDSFAINRVLAETTHLATPALKSTMVQLLAGSSIAAAREAAVPALLDPVGEQRREVALSLQANAQSVTPIMLRRLVAVRNWLPGDERHLVDQVVRSARLRGIDCAQWEGARTESILASTVDGSGTQGFMIVATAGDRQSVCSILAKRAVGIADAWCSGPQSRGPAKKILREAATAALCAQVPREYLDAIVQHHIQIGCEAGRVPPPGLLEVAEAIGGAQWQPNALPWRALLARLCAEIPPGELAPSAVKRALAELHDAGDLESMTESWFEDDHEARELVDRARHKDFRKSVDDLLRTLIRRRAEKWAEQIAWAAYWLRQTRSFGEARWMKFALVARALAEGVPPGQIALMRDIAARTVQARLFDFVGRVADDPRP